MDRMARSGSETASLPASCRAWRMAVHKDKRLPTAFGLGCTMKAIQAYMLQTCVFHTVTDPWPCVRYSGRGARSCGEGRFINSAALVRHDKKWRRNSFDEAGADIGSKIQNASGAVRVRGRDACRCRRVT